MAYQTAAHDRPALPEYLGRKGEGRMDAGDVRAIVQAALAQSAQFVDTELSTERARATEFYLGKPFGNEEEGRSQVILTEVRDAVDGMLPSLLRVFFGSEHCVEFVPTRPDQVQQAEQATEYIRYLFEEENGGFLKTLAVLKDGLIRKIGVFKWGWDETSETRTYRIEGIDAEARDLLLSGETDEGYEVRSVEERKDGLFNAEVTRTVDGRVKVWDLPPEEFVFNRQARGNDTALLRAHRTEKTRGELLAMGIKEAEIDEHAGAGESTDVTLRGNAEEIARRDVAGIGRVVGFGFSTDPDMGTANNKILYTETLMCIDVDGDGIAELRRVCCIGPQYWPVSWEPAGDEMGFSTFTPYPEPHTLLGGSVADRTMDVQKINSSLMRGMLDSLSAAIFPRTAYQEGVVSVADIMNTAIGAPIRVRGQVNNAIMPIAVPFTGKDAMPILQFMQDVLERRTGRQGAQSLDSDALQSTDKGAVGAVLDGRQESLEMICRIFAETTLKPLFKGLLKVVKEKQQKARVIRLRGTWVTIDPRSWDADMDVTVNIGLGTTFVDKKVATLLAVGADQKEIAAATGGMYSPVVPLPKLLATRQKIMALQGIKDFGSYYNDEILKPGWQPPPPPPPQPDPATVAIQAEHQMNQLKVVKELAIKQDELRLDAQKAEWDHQFQMAKLAADIEMKKYAADATNKVTLTQAALEHNLATETREVELTMAGHDQLHDQALERDALDHEQAMNERAADTADAQTAQAAQPEATE